MSLSNNKNPILKIEHLCVTFQSERILEDICFDVRENEFVAILGPSGCGKSTILNILSGSFQAMSGTVRLYDKEISGVMEHFAYMPQDDLLLPWYNILDNVTLYGKIHHTKEEARHRAREALKTFGLEGYENAYPKQLSGGMRQRAAFLRTVLCNAKVLLLDEPFGALDVISRNDMQDWLLDIRKSMKRTILLVTHDIDEALYLADRVIILSGKPTYVLEEIDLSGVQKSREWLYEQSDIKKMIYQKLRGEYHA